MGNKADITGSREVSYEDGEEMAQRINAAFYETSAFTGYNVKTWIDQLTKEVIKFVHDKSVSLRKTSSNQSRVKATILSSDKHTSVFSKNNEFVPEPQNKNNCKW